MEQRRENGETAASRAARRAARRRRAIRNRIIFAVVLVLLVALVVFLCVKIFGKSDASSDDKSTEATINTDDATPPEIIGAGDITVKLGETVSYKSGVTVTDDSDPNPVLTVNADNVDLTKPGVYVATYTATDANGNSRIVTVNVTVEEPETTPAEPTGGEAEPKATDPATQAEIDQMNYLAGLYLKQIVTNDMTDFEKAQRIWLWINWNNDYVPTSDKSSIVRGAIQYFDTHKGDCFNYFCAAKAMLELCGIQTVDVVKSDTSHSSHYWSLVNLGDGWYHFDTTPRDGGGDYFFLVTDEQLDAYSETHENSHIFDHDAYPARATKIITDMNAQPDYYDFFEQ